MKKERTHVKIANMAYFVGTVKLSFSIYYNIEYSTSNRKRKEDQTLI